MKVVHQIENVMAGWYKQVPHLPENGRKWIAENAWWITAIGVVVAVFAILALLPLLTGASTLLTTYSAYYAPYAAVAGKAVLSAWVSVAFFALVIWLEAMAIMPLKEKKRNGWNLIFMAMLVSVVGSVVSFVLTYEFSSLLGAVLGLAIGGYFLFEVRDKFAK